MKRTWFAVLTVALAATISQGSDPVYSANAVGYVRKTLERGKFQLIANTFHDVSGGLSTIDKVIGRQVPPGTRVYTWNVNTQRYRVTEYIAEIPGVLPEGWDNPNIDLPPGFGFFVLVPASASQPTYDLYMMGEVPDAATAPVTELGLSGGYTLTSLPYPVATDFLGTAVAGAGAPGDKIFIWNVVTQRYQVTEYIAEIPGVLPEGWDRSTLPLEPGQAYFYFNVGALKTATETKDEYYTWP